MERKTTILNKISYACGDIYGGGAYLLIGVLYLNFLTDIIKLNPALAGTIFLIGKIWDAISDPLMGILSDNTKSKFGRRRIYFITGVLPIFISFAMLWLSINTNSQSALFVYYVISYLFFNTILTMVMIPYNAILPSMTNNYKERTSFITVRLMFSNAAALISAVLPMFIIGIFKEDIKLGYAVMGTIFATFYALPYIILFFGTFENDYNHNEERKSFSFMELINEFKITFISRTTKIYLAFFILAQTAVDLVVTIFIYYLTYVLNMKELFAPVLGVLIIVQIISMPIHMLISNKAGKTAPMKFGLPVWIVALIISLFLDSNSSPVFIFLIAVLSGFGCSASIFAPWSVFPELADVDELITNRRREGVYSGLTNFTRKISQALAMFLIGVSLDFIGYVPNVAQSIKTLNGIKIMFGLVPVVFIFGALYFSGKYKLNEHKYSLIKEELRKRSDNDKSKSSQETINVCEELTGIKYERLGKF